MSISGMLISSCTITPDSYDTKDSTYGNYGKVDGTPLTGISCRIMIASSSDIEFAGRRQVEVSHIMYLEGDQVISRGDSVLMEDEEPTDSLDVTFIQLPSIQNHHKKVYLHGEQRSS